MKPELFSEDGRVLRLGERIGRGGEGEIYSVADDAGRVVKFYTLKELAERKAKVEAMVRGNLSASSDIVAFPISIVNRRNHQFAGFTMRRVDNHKPVFELYAPGARKQNFPHADYEFLVLSAANVARAVGSVHAAGCVIGDINPSGIFISGKETVTLIDADSFQYFDGKRRYLCYVGVPECTPPEIQGHSFERLIRTVEHDHFGLAVIIFQLLFMGKHPFSGAYKSGEMPIERAIGEYRFAYSRQRDVGMTAPPAAPLLTDFPPTIVAAFEAAFAQGSQRPSAAQWIALLTEFAKTLRPCKKNSLHHHWANAKECPWCRMESRQGIDLFLPRVSGRNDPTGTSSVNFDLNRVWTAIEAIQAPADSIPSPRLPDSQLSRSEQGLAARRARHRRLLQGGGLLLAGIAAMLGLAAVWPLWFGLLAWGAGRVYKDDPLSAAIKKELRDVESRWKRAHSEWQKRCSIDGFAAIKSNLQKARDEYSNLAQTEDKKIKEYQRNRRSEQLKGYLATFYIRRHKIAGLGPSRIATLSSYGVETALDVSDNAILTIPGFGPKTAAVLIAWRRSIEVRFVYDERPNAMDKARMAAIKAERVRRTAELQKALVGGAPSLLAAAREIESRRTIMDPQLAEIHLRRSQLKIDLSR